MTPQEIDAMEAGRELDALIAEKVMGCKVVKGYGGAPVCGCGQTSNYPHSDPDRDSQLFGTLSFYSTDIAAAWEVVMWFANKQRHFEISHHITDTLSFYVSLDGEYVDYDGWIYGVDALAITAPLAICRAALKAVLSE